MAALRSPIVGYGFLARWEQKQAAPSRLAAAARMEQVIAPPEIVAAIDGDSGDLVLIEAWVAAGGDPNAKIDISHEIRDPPGSWYETILHRAAYFKWPDICEFLLSRGARVDPTDATEGCCLRPTPLCCAVTLSGDSGLAMLRLILSHGADPNLANDQPHGSNCTPLIYAMDALVFCVRIEVVNSVS